MLRELTEPGSFSEYTYVGFPIAQARKTMAEDLAAQCTTFETIAGVDVAIVQGANVAVYAPAKAAAEKSPSGTGLNHRMCYGPERDGLRKKLTKLTFYCKDKEHGARIRKALHDADCGNGTLTTIGATLDGWVYPEEVDAHIAALIATRSANE